MLAHRHELWWCARMEWKEFGPLLPELHRSSCFAMVGVIWIIQLVHYPAFLWIDRVHFKAFSRFHADSITPVVLPLMVTELGSACGLLLLHNVSALGMINVASIVVIWLWTFFVSVPCHEKLAAEGWQEDTIRWLIHSNWMRTALWTSRGAALLAASF